jgi:glycosyltransferase involved in cell wall biosynthesis
VIHGLEVRGGGSHRATAELCETLAGLGHDVSLYYVTNRHQEVFAPKGVDVEGFPSQLLHKFCYSPALRRRLEAEIPGADLVHIHALWRYPGIPAARIALRHGIPYVVQPHGSLHPWKLAYKGLRKWLYGQLVERRVIRHAAFIHVESEADARDVQTYVPGAKTVLSPCGAAAAAFDDRGPDGYLARRWPALSGKTCILYLARIDVNKGIDLLLQAFSRVARNRPDLSLLIAGPDYNRITHKMQALACTLGIADRVVWAGLLSERERLWVLHQCEFYVLPSLSENFGISVLEAMFCSKPVITTTATPWAELEPAGAGLIVPPRADGVARAMQTLLGESATRRAQRGARGRTLAIEQYEWKSVARKLVRGYEQAIAEKFSAEPIRRRAA